MINRIAVLVLALLFMSMQAKVYRTYNTKNFSIHYEKRIGLEQIRSVGKLFESQYSDYRKRFGASLGARCDVYLLNSIGRFRNESQTRVFDDGDYRSGSFYLAYVPDSGSSEKLPGVICRIVSRAVLDKIIACPKWLAEGYSLYAGGDMLRFGRPADTNISGFEDVSEEYSRLDYKKNAREVYAKLAAAIDFLINRYGEKKVEAMLAKFSEGGEPEQVFEASFKEKYKDIEKAFILSLHSAPK